MPAVDSRQIVFHYFSQNVPLKNLLRNLDTIRLVRGRIRIWLPTQTETVRFDPLEPGASQKVQNLHLTLRLLDYQLAQIDPLILRFDCRGVEGRRLRWMAYDAQGEALREGDHPQSLSGLLELRLPVDTAAVVFKVTTLKEGGSYPFELRDIPLDGRAPWRLETARFPGFAAPVSAVCTQIQRYEVSSAHTQHLLVGSKEHFSRLFLSLTNHCQKDVDKVEARFTFLDEHGQPLGEVARTLQARFGNRAAREYSVQGSFYPNLFARAYGLTQLWVDDTQVPEGTKRVDIAVTRVTFADATTWAP
jgi:hypothetical protein